MALTKGDFAERLFNELAIDKRKAKAIVDLFLKKLSVH
jgi:nucleoid DNA-binding protein